MESRPLTIRAARNHPRYQRVLEKMSRIGLDVAEASVTLSRKYFVLDGRPVMRYGPFRVRIHDMERAASLIPRALEVGFDVVTYHDNPSDPTVITAIDFFDSLSSQGTLTNS
jgi:sporulation-control protein spo0M